MAYVRLWLSGGSVSPSLRVGVLAGCLRSRGASAAAQQRPIGVPSMPRQGPNLIAISSGQFAEHLAGI